MVSFQIFESLMSLLTQANEAWSRGRMEKESAERTIFGHDGHHKEAQMAEWGQHSRTMLLPNYIPKWSLRS